MGQSKVFIVALVILSMFAALLGSGLADLDAPYADEVVSFAQGSVWDTGNGSPPGTWGNTDRPEEALGGPTKAAASGNAYFVSLGAKPAGEIVLKFTDRLLIDDQTNAGFDLAIHEFGAQDDAWVYLANDRNEDSLPDSWVYLGYTATDASVSRLTGNHPPYISGNSTSILFLFDCAGKLDAIGGWASFIRIVDDNSGRTDPNFTDGFDLNAVEVLNYATLAEIKAKAAEDDACPEEEEPANPCQPDGGFDCSKCGNKSYTYDKDGKGDNYCGGCANQYSSKTENKTGTCGQCGTQAQSYSGCSSTQYSSNTGKNWNWWNFQFGKAFKPFMWWGKP